MEITNGDCRKIHKTYTLSLSHVKSPESKCAIEESITTDDNTYDMVYASEPLYRLLHIFAMGRSTHTKDWIKRFRGTVTIIVLLGISIFAVQERFVYAYPELSSTLIITDIVSLITLLGCAVCNILIDKMVRYKIARRLVSRAIYIVCVPLICLFCFETYNLIMLINWAYAGLYTINYLFHFINSLVSVHFYSCMYMVSSSFFILNNQLLEILEDGLSKSSTNSKTASILPSIKDFSIIDEAVYSWSELAEMSQKAVRSSKSWNFNELMKSYVYTCDQCDIFNSFFSIQNLLMALNGIIAILHSFHIVTLFGPMIKDSSNWIICMMLVTASCCFAIYNIGILLGITMSCEVVKQEASKTSLILDAFLYNKLLEKTDQVEMWAQLVVRRLPKFTACRVFTLDLTLMCSMAGTITTYLIILLQLH